MHTAGIVVVVRPGELERAADALDALPGVEVFHRDPEGGRLVIVQEASSARAQEEGFRRVQAVAGVATAALVEHRIDEVTEGAAEPTGAADSGSPEDNGRDR